MPDDVRWMTYAEVRDAFGLPTTKAAVQRSRRAKWARRQHNADRLARVAVPVAELALPRTASRTPPRKASRTPPLPAPGEDVGGTGGHPGGGTDPHGVHAVLAELKAAHDRLAGELRGRAERAEAEAAALRDAVASERDRANAALERALAAEAWLAAGSPATRVLKAWRAFLAQRGWS